MKFSRFSGIAVSAFAVFVSTHGALALDGTDFGNKLAAMFEANGQKITFNSVTVDGDGVSFSGFSFALPGEDDVVVPNHVVFSGVSETGDGGYLAEKGVIESFDYEEDDVAITVSDIVIEGLDIPAEALADPLDTIKFYRSFSVGPIKVQVEDHEVFSVASIMATNVPNADLTEFVSDYEVLGIHADLAIIDEAEAQAMLTLFGLQTIDAKMQGQAVWTLDDGRIQIKKSSITVDNVGSFDVTADIVGYDLAFLTDMQVMQKDLVASGDKTPEEIEAASMEILDLMVEKFSLNAASVRFDDDGITGKILDFIAKQQGAPREVLVAGFAAAVPAMAAQAGAPPAFQSMLLKAVAAYLDDPQNIEINSTPDAAVPFTAIRAVAEEENAAKLIDLIKIGVIANQ